MNASPEIDKLAAALAKAQGQIVPAKQDGQNPHLKNRYTTLSAVWDVIRKPLSDNGLAVVQVVTTEPDGMFLLTRLMHASGQFIEAVYPVSADSNRGVSAAQAVGGALTYARRYSLTALVGVVSDDDDDGNSAAAPQMTRGRPVDKQQPSEPVYVPVEGEEVWSDWSRPEHAIAWSMSTGVFDHVEHCRNAYAKVKSECAPKTARDMWQCWYREVMRRLAEEAAKQAVQDADEPLFS